MRISHLMISIVAGLTTLAANAALASDCAGWERNEHTDQFAAEPFGTLAFVRGPNYFVLARNRCTNLDTPALTLAINHNGALESQPSFVSAHVALVKVGGNAPDKEYLYRSPGYWNRDRSGVAYRSVHQRAHEDFNRDLNGDQTDFDKRYTDDTGRSWNDSVDTETAPALHFQSWNYRSTFLTKDELLEALRRKQISLTTQNYLISYKARSPGAAAGALPTFTVNASGYDCLFIRLAGTSNYSDIDGEYLLNLNTHSPCKDIVSGFTAVSGWWNPFR